MLLLDVSTVVTPVFPGAEHALDFRVGKGSNVYGVDGIRKDLVNVSECRSAVLAIDLSLYRVP